MSAIRVTPGSTERIAVQSTCVNCAIVNGGFFMSSSYPSFGNAPARPCQRCGRPLPPNEVYCGNCGQYNVIQLNNAVAQPSSGPSWGVAPPQTSYSSDQNEGSQWGQPPVQAPQNNPIADTLYLNSHLVHRVNLAISTGLPLSSQIPIISTRHPVNLQGRATSIQRHKRLSALNKHLSALSHRHNQ